ncbi:hypothetical protein HK096_004950 [Nowakowskiella sp. JEL0078]|nr:hypothetical protein HK096_004950 [Nowakowskiella sp. JEL0078]
MSFEQCQQLYNSEYSQLIKCRSSPTTTACECLPTFIKYEADFVKLCGTGSGLLDFVACSSQTTQHSSSLSSSSRVLTSLPLTNITTIHPITTLNPTSSTLKFDSPVPTSQKVTVIYTVITIITPLPRTQSVVEPSTFSQVADIAPASGISSQTTYYYLAVGLTVAFVVAILIAGFAIFRRLGISRPDPKPDITQSSQHSPQTPIFQLQNFPYPDSAYVGTNRTPLSCEKQYAYTYNEASLPRYTPSMTVSKITTHTNPSIQSLETTYHEFILPGNSLALMNTSLTDDRLGNSVTSSAIAGFDADWYRRKVAERGKLTGWANVDSEMSGGKSVREWWEQSPRYDDAVI